MSSSWERKTASILRKYRVKYKTEFSPIPFRKFRLDFICHFGRYIAIEIDWLQHFTVKSKIYDYFRDKKILKNSKVKKIYRVWYKNLEKKVISIIKYERFIRNVRIMIIVLIIVWFIYLFNDLWK